MKPDPIYRKQRESLVPIAEEFADRQFGKKHGRKGLESKEVYAQKWNYCFHQKMNRLWTENFGRNGQ